MAYVFRTIQVLRSPMFVVAAQDTSGFLRKIVQIRVTGGSRASLAVDFAYAPFKDGVFRRIDDPPLGTPGGTHNWFDPVESKLAQSKPKYSHHVDGNAHFSQDGRIFTEVRRAACPLHRINGHAFTLYALGVEKFPRVTEGDWEKVRRNKRVIIPLSGGAANRKMITLMGSVFRRDAYSRMLSRAGVRTSVDGPFTTLRHPVGAAESAAILASPTLGNGTAAELFVELRPLNYEIPDSKQDTLLFVGGFDSRNPWQWRDTPGCLVARFPAAYDERDLSALRWIDINQDERR